jgi:hypothetical protein
MHTRLNNNQTIEIDLANKQSQQLWAMQYFCV